jgi:hypothetical protein
MGTKNFNDTQLKHEKYVEKLCNKILPEYETVKRNVKLYRDSKSIFENNSKKIAGEIDVLACNGNTCDLYEVKCSRRIVKAKIQTKRLRQSINNDSIEKDDNRKYKIRHVYFYCGESDVIEKLSGKDRKDIKKERTKEIDMPPSIKNLY